MRYLSVCSGIEAASVAWCPLGWQAIAFSEIETFPSAVLKHHYPQVPNWGDLTRFKEWPDATFDVLVGGTPCQSFSVAGLRKGLADPRGNLALTYLAVLDRYRPDWCCWENVPGVLSADGGRAFGAFVGGLAELGYGWAYRVLDAQHFGLAQRRARVFVVGHLGDWRRAAAVLFERESLSGHPAPCREAGEDIAGCIGQRINRSRPELDGHGAYIPFADLAPTLNAHFGDKQGLEDQHINGGAGMFVAHALRADGFDASEDGTGRGTPIVPYTLAVRGRGDSHDLEYRQDGVANAVLTPNGGRGGIGVGAIAFSAKDHGADAGELAPTLRARGYMESHANGGVMPAVAFANTAGDTALGLSKPGCPPITGRNGDPGNVLLGMQVRRLTPRECERLQGFPDDYTLIPYRGKPAADGPRYKALGNSMAVPVMAWIGRRIQMVEDVCAERIKAAEGLSA